MENAKQMIFLIGLSVSVYWYLSWRTARVGDCAVMGSVGWFDL